MNISIVLPAKNEAKNITAVLQSIQALDLNAEVLVINDGSTDNTAELAELAGAKVISHPYSQGNGAAIKTGARNATGDITVFMDGDGQHNPVDIPMFLQKMEEGYDMVVGARNVKSQASLLRRIGNAFYNRFTTIMTGHKIDDLTSGFRAVKTDKFRKFLYLLPNGFSYLTTSTMAFFRSGFPVAYVPIHAGQRKGKSHIRLFRDGARFFIIILRIGSLFSPMRLFLPVSISLFLLGMGYYGYTYVTMHRFTNMSALLLNTSVITFLMGFLSEQVSALHYRHAEDD
ncbi:glycosyl transferase family protein [methanotrophic bacterial endosymbiont of Bathymodiolus sp.]|nr:glycosyl transferase family protein [methanotrophic bacterial endosymbiont of Bathymodiolus sp.]